MTDTSPSATLEAYRLSPQQRRVWIVQESRTPYRAQCVFALEGDLRCDALEKALNQVVARHEMLRSVFPRVQGRKIPLQSLSDCPPIWRRVDLSDLDAAGQTAVLETSLTAERSAPLDFEKGPLIQALLLTLSPTSHALVLTLPTLCADSLSLRQIVRELMQHYRGGTTEDEPVQYLQFSEWQHEVLETDDEYRQAGFAHWRKTLADPPVATRLPFEAEADDSEGTEFQSERIDLAPVLSAALQTWCEAEEVPAEVVLAACRHILLAGWGGQPDLLQWVRVDGRKYPELREAVGLFASYVPIRVCSDPGEGFRPFVHRMHEALQDAVAFQEYYWGDASETVLSAANDSRFGFSFEEEDPLESSDDLTFSPVETTCNLEPWKLQLCCVHRPDGLSVDFVYDARCYPADAIRRLASSFRTLLTQALQSSDRPLSTLSLLPPDERHKVLVDWNRTQQDFPHVDAVHHLIEAAARAHPEAVALVYEDQQLTYRELNARANQLAHYLRQQDIANEIPVGLYLERSPALLVGLLGILKAGGAYLPLDPALPPQRLAGMLAESRTRLIVTQGELPLWEGVAALRLDQDAELLAQESVENPTGGIRSTDLAYVIYTSGSTGRPKGVAIEHRQLLNYIYGVQERLGLEPGASYATVSTIAADLGNTALFPALCGGGTLHLISSERSLDPTGWRDYFGRHRIDCLKIVPSHLRALLGSGEDIQAMLPQATLVLGGEASGWDLIERIGQAAPELRVLNHYGPTETTVGVLTYAVQRGVDGAEVGTATVPLGRPLANSRVYVLNDALEPVPVGVTGELYIGGAGVGRGYLNRPDLTAERFVRDPFGSEPDGRMYRTGDRVRWLEDGDLEFLGRVDHQVKIRGYRIELGEIESVLRRQESVREAVVLAREDVPGDVRLVGYVVREAGFAGVEGLREHLEQVLPGYMVPASLVALARLPLTSNGKIDRNSLPAPEVVGGSGGYVGPESALESVLVGIWEELLPHKRIGVDQSFFDLGGHSLLATQVVSRVRETFQVSIPLRTLFDAPTIAGLAEHIRQLQRAEAGLQLPPLSPVSHDGDLPLSFSQQRLWFIDRLQPDSFLYNVPLAVGMRGQLDVSALQRALQEIVARHRILRTTYATRSGNPVQQILAQEPTFSLPLVDLSALPRAEREEEARRLCHEEALRPFALAHDPMIRGALLRLAPDEHVLLLTLHHIASDGWSKSILTRELSRLYNAYREGRPSPLPALTVQYADYAVWQRDWLQGDVLERQVAYWRERLRGAPPVLALPTDRAREGATSYQGAMERFRLPAALSADLRHLCRDERATPFMTLLAAFYVLLYRRTGQADLVVGTDVANRTQPETEQLIGFFLNHLVLRTDLSGDPSFREVIGRVRDTCLDAYAHQDLPFDKLVEVVQPERSTSHAPVFQVLFVIQNAPRGTIELSGLELSGAGGEFPASKFDLSLFLEESDDGLSGIWVYRTDLFDANSIVRLSDQFVGLLGELLPQPDLRIEDVELLAERGATPDQEAEAGNIRGARRRARVVVEADRMG